MGCRLRRRGSQHKDWPRKDYEPPRKGWQSKGSSSLCMGCTDEPRTGRIQT